MIERRTQKPEMDRTKDFVNGGVAFWWRDVVMPQRRRPVMTVRCFGVEIVFELKAYCSMKRPLHSIVQSNVGLATGSPSVR